MFLLKNKNQLNNDLNYHEKRERLFFHDMINLTHGLILFFNQRQNAQKNINFKEIQLLEREVRTLQSLIKDHFNYKHKNLGHTFSWVPFSIAEVAVTSLIQNYLPEESVQTFVHKNFGENINGEENVHVYFPVFYRIMNNLIKNMAEARTQEVYIDFNYNELGLIIETKNLRNSSQDFLKISDDLTRVLKDEKFSNLPEGLGLESVYHLATESGGKFDFEISNDYWINRVFLPNIQNKEQKKAS
jgi:hypothetical protein